MLLHRDIILFFLDTILYILFVHVCPRCHVPCAVDLCLWAQQTWRLSSSCVGCFPRAGMHPSAQLAGPPRSNQAPGELNRGPRWARSVLRSTPVLRSTSCLGGEWGVHVLIFRATNPTPESCRRTLINACSLYCTCHRDSVPHSVSWTVPCLVPPVLLCDCEVAQDLRIQSVPVCL